MESLPRFCVLFIILQIIQPIQPKIILLPWYNMAPRCLKIDTCWAESLVGLSMRVPDHWWESYNGSNLHDGKIVSFDVVSQKWNLLLDTRDDGDDLYLMAYEAVCEYSNKESSTFNEYQLPYLVVREGDDAIESEDGTLYSLTPTKEWTRVDYDDNN
jgi:hypothetical protein